MSEIAESSHRADGQTALTLRSSGSASPGLPAATYWAAWRHRANASVSSASSAPSLPSGSDPLHERLGPVDASLLEVRPNPLDRSGLDLAEQLAGLAVLALAQAGGPHDVHRLFEIAPLQSQLGLDDGVLGLEPGRRQFLANQFGPAVAGGRLFEDASADREPAVVDVPLGLRDPQRLLLMVLLILHHGLADRRPKLGDLGQRAAQLLGLVAVEQSRLEPIGRQVLLPAPDDGPGEPADEPLTVSVAIERPPPGRSRRLHQAGRRPTHTQLV